MVPSIFKEHVGVNISDIIEDVRINFAKSKLIHTNDSIEDIAILSGYNSAHSFRRAFKRNTGTTPSELSKNVKKRSGEDKYPLTYNMYYIDLLYVMSLTVKTLDIKGFGRCTT